MVEHTQHDFYIDQLIHADDHWFAVCGELSQLTARRKKLQDNLPNILHRDESDLELQLLNIRIQKMYSALDEIQTISKYYEDLAEQESPEDDSVD